MEAALIAFFGVLVTAGVSLWIHQKTRGLPREVAMAENLLRYARQCRRRDASHKVGGRTIFPEAQGRPWVVLLPSDLYKHYESLLAQKKLKYAGPAEFHLRMYIFGPDNPYPEGEEPETAPLYAYEKTLYFFPHKSFSEKRTVFLFNVKSEMGAVFSCFKKIAETLDLESGNATERLRSLPECFFQLKRRWLFSMKFKKVWGKSPFTEEEHS